MCAVVHHIATSAKGYVGDAVAIHACGCRHAVSDMHTLGADPFAVAIIAAVGAHPEIVVGIESQVVLSIGSGIGNSTLIIGSIVRISRGIHSVGDIERSGIACP